MLRQLRAAGLVRFLIERADVQCRRTAPSSPPSSEGWIGSAGHRVGGSSAGAGLATLRWENITLDGVTTALSLSGFEKFMNANQRGVARPAPALEPPTRCPADPIHPSELGGELGATSSLGGKLTGPPEDGCLREANPGQGRAPQGARRALESNSALRAQTRERQRRGEEHTTCQAHTSLFAL